MRRAVSLHENPFARSSPAADEPALREVGGEAVVYAEDGDFATAVRRALADRGRLVAAGLERAKGFSWRETARRTAEAYRQVLA